MYERGRDKKRMKQTRTEETEAAQQNSHNPCMAQVKTYNLPVSSSVPFFHSHPIMGSWLDPPWPWKHARLYKGLVIKSSLSRIKTL